MTLKFWNAPFRGVVPKPPYSDFLAAIQDPKHEEHEEMMEWVGGEFDPDEFNMNFINKKLNDLKF